MLDVIQGLVLFHSPVSGLKILAGSRQLRAGSLVGQRVGGQRVHLAARLHPDVAVVFEDLLKELNLDSLIDRKLAQDIIGSQDGIAHEIGVKKIK